MEKDPSYEQSVFLSANRSTWQIGELYEYGNMLPSCVGPKKDSLVPGRNLKSKVRGKDFAKQEVMLAGMTKELEVRWYQFGR